MKCDDGSAEKTEAIEQCPGWIVFAMCGFIAVHEADRTLRAVHT